MYAAATCTYDFSLLVSAVVTAEATYIETTPTALPLATLAVCRARREWARCPSMSVLTAAAIGPVVDSAAVRVRAGDARSACIESTPTALPLAAPFTQEPPAAAKALRRRLAMR